MAGGAVRGGNPGGSFPALRASERNPSDCFLSTGSYGNRNSITAKVFGEGGMGLGEGRGKLFFRKVPLPPPIPLMPGNTIFFQLILHQTLGYAEQFRSFGLYEVGADERAADKRGFDALKGIGKIKLHRKQVHGALERWKTSWAGCRFPWRPFPRSAPPAAGYPRGVRAGAGSGCAPR